MLGDEVVIADPKVADNYLRIMTEMLGVKISEPKSLISSTGFFEFANKFMSYGKDLSPVSCRMLNSLRYTSSVAAILQLRVSSLGVSMRLRGESYRRYNACPGSLHPTYNRNWYRHMVIFFSPRGLSSLPFSLWLSFPDYVPVHPNLFGAAYFYLVKSCKPDWESVDKTALSLYSRDDDLRLFIEKDSLGFWMEAACAYTEWYCRVVDQYGTVDVEELLDPPAAVFNPGKRTQSKFLRYGKLARCYYFVRSTIPEPGRWASSHGQGEGPCNRRVASPNEGKRVAGLLRPCKLLRAVHHLLFSEGRPFN